MKILFQGDSITDAHRRPEEINPAFQLGNGYVFLIAARLACDDPARCYEFVNRGISGQTTEHLRLRWQEDAIAISPDLFSILVGINDVGRHFDGRNPDCLERFVANYRVLLGTMREANPALPQIVLEPFLVNVGPDRCHWAGLLSEIQSATAEIAATFSAGFVPLQRLFDAASESAPTEIWSYDGIHPTHAGFQLIADAWLHAAKPHFQLGAATTESACTGLPVNIHHLSWPGKQETGLS